MPILQSAHVTMCKEAQERVSKNIKVCAVLYLLCCGVRAVSLAVATGRTCLCNSPSSTYDSDLAGCVAPVRVSTPIPYSVTSGGSASVPGVTDVQLAPGTFDAAATAIPAVIDVATSSAEVDSLLNIMTARFTVVSSATKVVVVSTTQQPKKPVQVCRREGDGKGRAATEQST